MNNERLYDDTILQLIDAGCDVKGTTTGSMTALMRAAWKGHKSTVELLLVHGADPKARDINGNTAAEIAEGL